MNNLFMPRDLSSSPDVFLPDISDLNNFVLPPIRPLSQRNERRGIRNHLDTLRDVESAFHNADLALRNAREALRNDRIMASRSNQPRTVRFSANDSNNRSGVGTNNNIVDLTSLSSDTSNEEPEAHVPHIRRPNAYDSEHQPGLARHSAIRPHLTTDHPFQIFPPTWTQMGFGTRPISNQRAEESAIRRQRQARRSWERVERRNRERAAEQAQRDAVENDTMTEAQMRETLDGQTIGEVIASVVASRPRRTSSNSTSSSFSVDTEYSLGSEDTNATTQQNTQGTSNTVDSNTMTAAESIDLTSIEEQSTIDTVLSKQQQSAIESQKSTTIPKESKLKAHATSLSTYRCAICMDTPTTATTTICGHLFCHPCLKDSLKWSSQQRRDDAGLHGRRLPNAGTGLCPVCRKVLSDKEGGAKPGIVGLEIRRISRKDWECRKKQQQINDEREDFLRGLTSVNAETDKGKEREDSKGKDRGGQIKTENLIDGVDLGGARFGLGKATGKRRRDETGGYENNEGF